MLSKILVVALAATALLVGACSSQSAIPTSNTATPAARTLHPLTSSPTPTPTPLVITFNVSSDSNYADWGYVVQTTQNCGINCDAPVKGGIKPAIGCGNPCINYYYFPNGSTAEQSSEQYLVNVRAYGQTFPFPQNIISGLWQNGNSISPSSLPIDLPTESSINAGGDACSGNQRACNVLCPDCFGLPYNPDGCSWGEDPVVGGCLSQSGINICITFLGGSGFSVDYCGNPGDFGPFQYGGVGGIYFYNPITKAALPGCVNTNLPTGYFYYRPTTDTIMEDVKIPPTATVVTASYWDIGNGEGQNTYKYLQPGTYEVKEIAVNTAQVVSIMDLVYLNGGAVLKNASCGGIPQTTTYPLGP